MYHNWYELYMVTKQVQKDLYRRADEARLADARERVERSVPRPGDERASPC